MKRGIILLVLAILLGLAMFRLGYRNCCVVDDQHSSNTHRELAWLEKEFKLTPDQMLRITEIHKRFLPVCDELCMKVMRNSKKISALIKTNQSITPEMQTLLDESARLHEESHRAVLAHLYEIKSEMPPDQADRYMTMMMPLVIDVPYNTHAADNDAP